MLAFLLALVGFVLSLSIQTILMPRQKVKPFALPAPDPFTYHVDEPEHEFDPLAFWLFPDWDSGPPEEPFWMRPLKQPSPSYRIERNHDMPMMYGRHKVPGVIVQHYNADTGTVDYEPAGSVFDYMMTDEEWDERYRA